ncbi:membrane metalloprotease [Luteirhabdus pelagi]|jgi:predicted Zn-dependent protease with MMP-like domain|uniref:membrane metalloprotease n=1 Tax=Luteirhabdus pelagi TaxID=2792783 RepID=UPI0019393FA8|nr:membrane metalloprotease [Luteirhabdus pelagi]
MNSFAPKILLLFSLLFVLVSCKKDDDGASNDPTAENKKALGRSAEDLLNEAPYSNLIIEIAHTPATRPTEQTLSSLEQFLEARLNKPGGVSIVETNIGFPTGSPYTTDEIRDIEDANRTQFTEDGTIAVFVLFIDGQSNNDTDTSVTLGTAYRNTSIVIYQQTLQTLIANNPASSLEVLESTTVQHEFGHLLGLVNILEDDIHDNHEDPSNGRHCVVENCLMYFEANNIQRSVLQRFLQSRSNVPQLDPLCIEDLQAKGGL